jgi:hypothetical protein
MNGALIEGDYPALIIRTILMILIGGLFYIIFNESYFLIYGKSS